MPKAKTNPIKPKSKIHHDIRNTSHGARATSHDLYPNFPRKKGFVNLSLQMVECNAIAVKQL